MRCSLAYKKATITKEKQPERFWTNSCLKAYLSAVKNANESLRKFIKLNQLVLWTKHCFCFSRLSAYLLHFADGMWLPQLLQKLNEKNGAENKCADIYSIQ